MYDQTLLEELTASYHDKLADLLLNKNLEEHYSDVSRCVRLINALVDSNKLLDEELLVFREMGYQYYRLKDQFMEALILKEAGGSK